MYSLVLLAAVWGGRWLLGDYWPSPWKLWLVSGLGLIGVASSLLLSAKNDGSLYPRARRLTFWQGIVAVVWTTMVGVFATWLIFSP
jgi:hypothetical protein